MASSRGARSPGANSGGGDGRRADGGERPTRIDGAPPEESLEPTATRRAPSTSAPGLEVLYRDADLVALSKPGGMLVHRTALARGVRTVLLQTAARQLGVRLYPVHRLDRAASGVILFATRQESARPLKEALESAECAKHYLALVRGSTALEFECDRPLTDRDSPARPRRPARSEFRRLAEFSRMSLLTVRIHTGRRHQIRRHLHHLAHQIVGDTTYGKGRINRALREQFGLPRLFLHAWQIRLDHPRTGVPLRVRAPLAEDLRAFMRRLPDVPADLWRILDAGPATA